MKSNGTQHMKCVLVGNKKDLEEQLYLFLFSRKVSSEEALIFAKENNMEYIETSALEGNAIEEVSLILKLVILFSYSFYIRWYRKGRNSYKQHEWN